MANGARIRKDVWKLADWDQVLLWYARAIAEMKRRPINDPTSWRYQAAIHDYIRTQDPLASTADRLPSAADQRRFWKQCQHNSWFFLPWHRMYLGYFEQIVAATVSRLGGPAGWTLPYWNYSDASNGNARRLPPAFRALRTPDGVDNPLRVAARNPEANRGDVVAADEDVDLTVCLRDPSFVAQPLGGDPGFGGPRTRFNHSGGAVGNLELTPHGSMHVAVGGWMGRFNTAALDPIFWLHHANIDRLWVVWRQRDARHLDPTDQQWLRSVSFQFHDAGGNVVSLTPAQVVDTSAAPLGYRYEDVTDPLAGTLEAVAQPARRPEMEQQAIPEMVGATEGPVVLAGQATTARLAVQAPTGPAREGLEAAAAPPRIFLNLENITGSGAPTSYAVYLNLPPGADPQQHRDLFAGILPMFGVTEASQPGQTHPGGGLHYTLEIGDVVRTLQARNAWDPQNMQVTFVPRRKPAIPEGELEAPAPAPIQVGRVSVYYA